MGDPFVADDLVQETFSRALKNTKSWVEATSVEAFMIHIAKCVCADYIRSVEKDRKVTTLARINRQDHQDVDYTVLDITHCLSSDQREAFLLTQFLGFSYEECAAIMGTAVGTVRSRVSRARAQLQDIVQEA